jgi:Zn2+/Cd2+-exporting ATPase
MDCAEEVAILKRAVGPVVGGADRLSFDVLNGRMVVDESPVKAPDSAIVQAVRSTGMRAELWGKASAQDLGSRSRRNVRTWLTIASGVLLVSGFALHAWVAGGVSYGFGAEGMGTVEHVVPAPARIVYALSVICGAWFIVSKAWYAARALRPDMNLLMAIAVVGAIGIGEWFEAGRVFCSRLLWRLKVGARRAVALGIRMNIVLSLGVKALFVVLTFAGFASLWAAIAADMGVSLLVIANALRLLADV